MSSRFPILTVAVGLLTAAVSTLGNLVPAVLLALRRDGALISAGQLWRPVTSLLVQDGGWLGTATNVMGLIVLGVIAERRCGRGRWLLAYLGAGLVGELAGWAGWQPVGAGNSVAVCGLAGLVAVTIAGGRGGWVRPGAVAVTVWAALMALGAVPGLVVAVVAAAAVVAARVSTRGWIAPAAVVLAASALLWHADIHGAALTAGLLIAAASTVAASARRHSRTRGKAPARGGPAPFRAPPRISRRS